ncbi:response regulator [bacterium]|nr:response regulator [bacterium]
MKDRTAKYAESDAHVLLVDDEEMVLATLRAFLELETGYRVTSFTDPAAAVAFGREHAVDVVVADFLMPGTNGIEVLREFAASNPHAPRILLTGYADKASAIKAINEVGLFQYLEKPWDNDQFLVVLRNALDRRFLVKELQAKIREIDQAQGRLSGLQDDILRTFI